MSSRNTHVAEALQTFFSGFGVPAYAVGAVPNEAELPNVLNPRHGLLGRYSVRVRPGERAKLCFEILGPAKYPVVDGH